MKYYFLYVLPSRVVNVWLIRVLRNCKPLRGWLWNVIDHSPEPEPLWAALGGEPL